MSAAVKVLIAGGALSLGLMGLALFLPAAEPPGDAGWEEAPAPVTRPLPRPPAPVPGPRARVAPASSSTVPLVRPPSPPPPRYESPEVAQAPVPAEAREARQEPTLEEAREKAQQAIFVQERIDAVRWLGQNGGPTQHTELRGIIQEDQSPEVRREAEVALEQLRARFPSYDWSASRGRPLPSGRGGPSRSAQ